MKFTRLLCLLAVLVFLLPVVGTAASEDPMHETFATGDAAALDQLYREDPDAFLSALAKEEQSLIRQVAQKVVSAQTDVNAFYTDLFLRAVGKDWTENEETVIKALFRSDSIKFMNWIGAECYPGDKIGYDAFFQGYWFYDGASATQYILQAGKLLRQEPKSFVRELAKQDAAVRDLCMNVYNEMSQEQISETVNALQALRNQEQWSAAELELLDALIVKGGGNPKTADGSCLALAFFAGLLSLCACAVLTRKASRA